MSNRLSHSAASRYQSCGREYFYHYIEGWREKTTSGALLFGSAIDAAINTLLTKEGNALEVFEEKFFLAKIGNTEQEIPFNENVVYASSDFDADLLTAEDVENLIQLSGSTGLDGDAISQVKEIANLKKHVGWVGLSIERKKYYNYANWLSLSRKGFLMIDAYTKNIAPKIKKVLASQRKIEITNNDGDSVIGYVDAVVQWEDGRTIVFDLKTSSIEYDENAVEVSPQLALYVHALAPEFGTRTAGFIVLRKGIIKNRKKICKKCFYEAEKGARHKTCNQEYGGKRCNSEWDEQLDPQVDMQILIQDIPERMEEMVMDNYDAINQLIKSGIFVRNFSSCVKPWGRCAFYSICHAGTYENLEKKEE